MDAAHDTTHNLFPPVVAVLGHVDHGKTTLLDAIRKSSIAEREYGGITQKIGASSIEVMHEGKPRRITFIDTPGHQAFSQMRSRGARVADIGLLIVSAVDGVMPQTRESIAVLKAAQIPYIVVLTKADLPTKNTEKTKQQLLREEVMLEGLGGDIPVIEVSAKTNSNIQELLDLILLLQELHPATSVSPDHPLKAIVIESKLDQKAGPRATVVVKDGSFSPRDDLRTETESFRVRTITTDLGAQVMKATIGEAVEVLGMKQVPAVGSIMTQKDAAVVQSANGVKTAETELVYQPNADTDKLAIILITDTQGSLEAIVNALPETVNIILKKTGEVTEGDILLAKSVGAIVLGFNTKIRPDVARLAITEKVLAKNYQIIYEMLDEIADVLEGKRLAGVEEIYGSAQVLAKFPFEKTFAFGISVMDGRIARGDKVRVIRGDETIGETGFSSLRIGKNPTSKVEKGNEAGVVFAKPLDIQVGDVILSHS